MEQLNSKYLLFSFSTDQLFVLSPQGKFKSRRQVIRLISAPLQIFYFRDNVTLQLIPFNPFAVFKSFLIILNSLPRVLQFTLEPLNCTWSFQMDFFLSTDQGTLMSFLLICTKRVQIKKVRVVPFDHCYFQIHPQNIWDSLFCWCCLCCRFW